MSELDPYEAELIGISKELMGFVSAVFGALVGGFITFLAMANVQKQISKRERLFHTLTRLESAQLASQILSSKWRRKIWLFHQKAKNRPFSYLDESEHPGDEKFKVQFLVQAFLPQKLGTQLDEIDIWHKKLKVLFEDADEKIRREAVRLVGMRRPGEPHRIREVTIDDEVVNFDEVYQTAFELTRKLDRSITAFKEALLEEIQHL